MMQYIDRADQELKKVQSETDAVKNAKPKPEMIDEIAEVIKKKVEQDVKEEPVVEAQENVPPQQQNVQNSHQQQRSLGQINPNFMRG